MMSHGGRRAVMLLGCLMLALTPRTGSAADSSGTWSVVAHLPQPRGESAMTAMNGKLYVLGGYTPGNEASPRAEEYDPGSKAWRVLPSFPRAVSHPGAAALDGKLYVVGVGLRRMCTRGRSLARSSTTRRRTLGALCRPWQSRAARLPWLRSTVRSMRSAGAGSTR